MTDDSTKSAPGENADLTGKKLDITAFADLKAHEIESRLTIRIESELKSESRYRTAWNIALLSLFIGVLGILGYSEIKSILNTVPDKIRERVALEFEVPKIQKIVEAVAADYTRKYADNQIRETISDRIRPLDADLKLIKDTEASGRKQIERLNDDLKEIRDTEESARKQVERLKLLSLIGELRGTASFDRDSFDRLRALSAEPGEFKYDAQVAFNEVVRNLRSLSQVPDVFRQEFILNSSGEQTDVQKLTIEQQFDLLGNPVASIQTISDYMAIIRANHSRDEIVPIAIRYVRDDKRTTAAVASAGILRSLFIDRYATVDFSDLIKWVHLADEGKLK